MSIPSLGGGQVDRQPSLSISFLIYISLHPYSMLTLVHSSNTDLNLDFTIMQSGQRFLCRECKFYLLRYFSQRTLRNVVLFASSSFHASLFA